MYVEVKGTQNKVIKSESALNLLFQPISKQFWSLQMQLTIWVSIVTLSLILTLLRWWNVAMPLCDSTAALKKYHTYTHPHTRTQTSKMILLLIKLFITRFTFGSNS